MSAFAVIAFCTFVASTKSQQIGSISVEDAPPIVVQKCTLAGGCVPEDAFLTLDANWRWLHGVNGYQNCYSDGEWDASFCPDGRSCALNCAVEGVDAEGYRATYGVQTAPDGVELEFVADGGNVGSRLYVRSSEDEYKMFKLKNREFTLDVDTSTLACGQNGAVYFVEMDANGGKGKGANVAGAKYGTGYCDAQCPHDVKYQEGEVNLDGNYGMCCVEMDIWEANSRATAYTPHPCSIDGPLRCNGTACGDGASGERYNGVCDKDGCDLNAFRMGNPSFYGPGPDFHVDSTKPLTVVTQFLTVDGTDTGNLSEIRRLYVQDGKVIEHSSSAVPGVSGNSVTDSFCSAQKAAFGDIDHHMQKGGLKQMGEALERGLVLALSLWDDGATHMRWLDSTFPQDANPSDLGVARGPCDGTTSNPTHLRTEHADSTVKYTNIMYGEIGSTFSASERRLHDTMMI